MTWFDDLCEYYSVSPDQAVLLGTRKTGRRPNLPGSATCKPVSGMNFEELWEANPRETIQQKMDFYKDIGAWQVFRQCNYRQNFNYASLFFPHIKPGSSIVEYGCGVAPVTNYIVERAESFGGMAGLARMKFCLVDVEGEHLEFAKWRLKKKAPGVDFDVHEINSDYTLPNFDRNFDIISIMDVFEHLPNPYEVMTNLYNHSNPGVVLVETWRDGYPGGPDLQEAEDQKKSTMNFINSHFRRIKGGSIRVYKGQ